MSIPAWALPSIPTPDRPRSSFGMTIGRLEELRDRIREEEGDWTRVQILKREQEELLIGVLSKGLSGDVPAGTHVRFAPSDRDPNSTLCITVSTQDLRNTYYLKDQRPGRTPFQQGVIGKARTVIKSRG